MRSRTSTRRRGKADWVFRDDIFDQAGNNVDAGGTYTPWGSFVLLPGQATAQGHVLYDSANYRQYVRSIGNVPVPYGSWSRAEGRQARTLMVRGSFAVTPSNWALGSSYFFGARIVVCDQDEFGSPLLSALYTMWAAPLANELRPARWANGYHNKWEMYHIERFNDNNFTRNWRVFTRARARLRPNECLAFYTESATGSVNLTVNCRLSTLVVDEG